MSKRKSERGYNLQFSTIDKKMSKRPDYGSKGRHTRILSNYFEIQNISNVTELQKYDIHMKMVTAKAEVEGKRTIPPKQLPGSLSRKVFEELERKMRDKWFRGVGIVYDGNNTLYSTAELNLDLETDRTSVLLAEEQDSRGNPIEFDVQIRKITVVNMEELRVYLEGLEFRWENFDMAGIKGLNALLHHLPSVKYTKIGESSIYLPTTRKSLGNGVELWMGWFESVRPGQDSYFVNVNTTYTVFYEPGDLPTFIVKFLGVDQIPSKFTPSQNDKLNKVLKELSCFPLHRPGVKTKYRIKRLSLQSASETMIEWKEHNGGAEEPEKTIDLVAYYLRRYDITLKYPHLVELAGRRNDKLPIECCGILEGQRFPVSELTGSQRGQMIKYTALRPQDNVKRIGEGVNNVLQWNTDDKLKQFGTQISDKMTEVPARILNPPAIVYHTSSKAGGTLRPFEGGWNLRDRKFVISGVSLNYWVVVAFVDKGDMPYPQINRFIQELVRTSRDQGMDIVEQRPNVIYARPYGDVNRTVITHYNATRNYYRNAPQLMMFILPDDDDKLYKAIKLTADTTLGVPSQCVQAEKISRPNKQYCANVALKINLKLGGTNSALETNEIPWMTKEPVLLLGADVTHPTSQRGTTLLPSICAVVGSLDRQGGRFIAKLEAQRSRQEKIDNMSNMVKEILDDYYSKNNALPERIIMYRDGVSESQFEMVLTEELQAMKDACLQTQRDYNPPITFIVVGKRHHTRFYPQLPEDADNKGNCMAGTVVDKKITHPFLFDFFLQSHTSLHGTSRPAHYHVLHDENKFSADVWQEFTHKLCYNYQRATRAVSIAPPAYYAHLAAKRARLHIDHQRGKVDSEPLLRQVKQSLAQDNTMYFV